MAQKINITDKTEDYGREHNGRFTKGNTFAKGNPYAKEVAEFRRTIMNSISSQDIADIMTSLVDKAKKGDTAAAKLVLNFSVGKPQNFEYPDSENSLYETKPIVTALEIERKLHLSALKVAGTPLLPHMIELINRLNNISYPDSTT